MRRTGAAAGGGERRRPCREAVEAGEGPKSKEARERRLLPRGIGEGAHRGGESRRRGARPAAMEVGNGARVWAGAGRARGLEGRGSGRPCG